MEGNSAPLVREACLRLVLRQVAAAGPAVRRPGRQKV